MSSFITTSPSRTQVDAVEVHDIPAEAPFSTVIKAGQIVRIEDSYGQQAIDTLFYNASDFSERYSNQDTMRQQGAAYISTGTKVVSNEGRVMLTASRAALGYLSATFLTGLSKACCVAALLKTGLITPINPFCNVFFAIDFLLKSRLLSMISLAVR